MDVNEKIKIVEGKLKTGENQYADTNKHYLVGLDDENLSNTGAGQWVVEISVGWSYTENGALKIASMKKCILIEKDNPTSPTVTSS